MTSRIIAEIFKKCLILMIDIKRTNNYYLYLSGQENESADDYLIRSINYILYPTKEATDEASPAIGVP